MQRLAVLALASLVSITGCGRSPLEPDAAIACGWNEPPSPVVSAVESDAQQLKENASSATTRLEAAKRVAQIDARFDPLVEALEETSKFADELTRMSRSEIAAIPTTRWDFAKYVQAAARDQCEQLAAVVESQ